MRVLVTSSRNTFALDIIRKLGSLGHTVVAADTYRGAVGSHSKYASAHEVVASPRFDTDQFIADVDRVVKKHDIGMIIPTFEETFYLAARRHDLPSGVQLYSGDFEDLARLHDKASFKRLASEAGVPVPKTVVVTSDQELEDAIAALPRYFARAAFSRGGVGLLTNTGPLAGKISSKEVHPTPDQPWLVQPFVDGPMVCTYSTVVDGKVTSHCTYRAPQQWAHSTGIAFLSVAGAETLGYVQALVDQLGGGFTGQLSFDFVDNDGELYAIECNPRPTNGVILMEPDSFERALTGAVDQAVLVPPGVEKAIKAAVVADAFGEPIKHLASSLRDLADSRDVGHGWHDTIAMMWSPATLVHGAQLSRGKREEILAALADDIVWNGEPIVGMTSADAQALEAVHEQRI